jgi:hypothetical protein
MAQFEQNSVFAGDEADKGPSMQEQYDALKAEGIIAEDGESPEDAQGGAQGEPGQAEVPDWVPEKFRSAADPMKAMAEAYAALERKQSSPDDEDEGDDVEDDEEYPDDEGTVTEEERAAAENATKKAGLDLQAVQAEWDTDGGLSDETYDALEAAGYPREAVDVYIEGLLARNSAATGEAYGIVGGQDAYSEMVTWAAENLSDEEIEVYDNAVNSRNPAAVRAAVRGLNAQWTQAIMQEANEEPEEEITPKGNGTTGSKYASMDDYMDDLNDPRYDTSETFRAQVIAKLGRSSEIM